MNFLHFLAQLRTPAGDMFFQMITLIAQEFFVVAVICWLFWCSDKKLAYTLGFAYFFSGLLVQGLKITFRIPRPWILDPEFSAVPSAVPGATGYSFPSGHTQSVTAMFGTFALRAGKASLKFLCLIVIAAVMLSRMYLGVHTPADVGVSFLITICCTAVNYFYIYKKDSLGKSSVLLSFVLIAAAAALGVYAVILQKNGTIEIKYAEDCIKAAGAGAAFCLGFLAETRRIRFSRPESVKAALIRFFAGIIGALLILEGIKPLLGSSLPSDFFRYFLTVLWITAVYPLIFTEVKRRKSR